jgi:hypothetical protein
MEPEAAGVEAFANKVRDWNLIHGKRGGLGLTGEEPMMIFLH